ncbi:SDR family oxidoreductase [Rhodococcus qingshengii]|uniref:SDR family oxidoreductase n=1 Tax=Rhodococcus qingshengii TaxID=334542 RepID=UPI0036DC7950
MGDLKGQTAIVTGASRGIGLAAARALFSAGANVVLTARTEDAAQRAALEIGGGVRDSQITGLGAHVADEEAAARCVSSTIERYGPIDILVNNVGTNPAYGPLIDQDRGRFAKLFEVNVWAPLSWTSLVAKSGMLERGGSVVNTASIGGLILEPTVGAYNASKAALIHMTKQLALELSPTIRVNAIAPGVVRTRLAEALWREHEDSLSQSTPLGRIGEPDDVASAVLFLASDAAKWITGETMVIDGGQRLGNPEEFRGRTHV